MQLCMEETGGDLFDDPIVALCVDIKGLDGWFCR